MVTLSVSYNMDSYTTIQNIQVREYSNIVFIHVLINKYLHNGFMWPELYNHVVMWCLSQYKINVAIVVVCPSFQKGPVTSQGDVLTCAGLKWGRAAQNHQSHSFPSLKSKFYGKTKVKTTGASPPCSEGFGIFNVWLSSKCSTTPASAVFMATGTNCFHQHIPSGKSLCAWGRHLPILLKGLRPVSYPQCGLALQ